MKLVPRREKFDSLDDMDMWFKHNICRYLPVGVENYLKRVEANFVAAKKDNIIRLALDFGYGEIFALGGMENFVRTIEKMHKQFASDIEMIPTLVIRDCSRLDRLAEILSFDWYKAIDIINYNDSLSLHHFTSFYRKKCRMRHLGV